MDEIARIKELISKINELQSELNSKLELINVKSFIGKYYIKDSSIIIFTGESFLGAPYAEIYEIDLDSKIYNHTSSSFDIADLIKEEYEEIQYDELVSKLNSIPEKILNMIKHVNKSNIHK